MNPTVRLAEAVRSARAGETQQPGEQDQGRAEEIKYQADLVAAFEQSQRPVEELYEEESIIRGRFAFGAGAFGAFIALIVGGKLIQLSVRRRRTDYEADRATCLACGRCFRYCPREQLRRKGPKTQQAGEAK
jgi:ferredoxin